MLRSQDTRKEFDPAQHSDFFLARGPCLPSSGPRPYEVALQASALWTVCFGEAGHMFGMQTSLWFRPWPIADDSSERRWKEALEMRRNRPHSLTQTTQMGFANSLSHRPLTASGKLSRTTDLFFAIVRRLLPNCLLGTYSLPPYRDTLLDAETASNKDAETNDMGQKYNNRSTYDYCELTVLKFAGSAKMWLWRNLKSDLSTLSSGLACKSN
ncbi:uncharacterized protein EV422DRAFT_504033 [Fimicolochytrium jonesii]|uniref:uncharacterized protein n=1 Tax=Fimicolochytrium jonesii TaxID=1396493 RepID=UPI0022FE47FA|nr:uncharacterized protein EV422DRAFT_504033 [Fimicolochytrium jonesii]KAI8825321.1 hypothetical protein EV422DRAFT_504033 [Fimicolochytrium jonesii]